MSRSTTHRVYAPSACKSIQPDETTERELLDAINIEEGLSGSYLLESCEDEGPEFIVEEGGYCD
jgi:hypothetical protein